MNDVQAPEPVGTATAMIAREQAGYQLVAVDEAEMRGAHKSMVEWAVDRQRSCREDRAELDENRRVAEENDWNAEPFKKRIALLDRRLKFYAKIEAALKQGYVIVPNFEMTVFAIRTDAHAPRGETTKTGHNYDDFVQQSKLLALGEGEYRNPLPALLEERHTEPDGKGGTITKVTRWADEFKMLQFPLALAKPMLMERTAAAMRERTFDEIGVAVDTARRSGRGDPIILGRIRNPRTDRPHITFFIGWYFDPSSL